MSYETEINRLSEEITNAQQEFKKQANEFIDKAHNAIKNNFPDIKHDINDTTSLVRVRISNNNIFQKTKKTLSKNIELHPLFDFVVYFDIDTSPKIVDEAISKITECWIS